MVCLPKQVWLYKARLFKSHREILSKFSIFIIAHTVHAFSVLKPEVRNISLDIKKSIRISAHKHFLLIQNKYSFNEENQSLGQGLSCNGIGHFTITSTSGGYGNPSLY